jgi:hypothetical protein
MIHVFIRQMYGDIIISEQLSISADSVAVIHWIPIKTGKKILKLTEILLHILTIRISNLSPYIQYKVMKIQMYRTYSRI